MLRQRRLAGTVMPQHRDKRSLRDINIHAVNGAVGPHEISIFVALIIFIDQFLCMDHFQSALLPSNKCLRLPAYPMRSSGSRFPGSYGLYFTA